MNGIRCSSELEPIEGASLTTRERSGEIERSLILSRDETTPNEVEVSRRLAENCGKSENAEHRLRGQPRSLRAFPALRKRRESYYSRLSRSDVTRRCVSRSHFLPGGSPVERERKGETEETGKTSRSMDRSVCRQTKRRPIRREDLTGNRPNGPRRFGRNSAGRFTVLPRGLLFRPLLELFDAAMTIVKRITREQLVIAAEFRATAKILRLLAIRREIFARPSDRTSVDQWCYLGNVPSHLGCLSTSYP